MSEKELKMFDMKMLHSAKKVLQSVKKEDSQHFQ